LPDFTDPDRTQTARQIFAILRTLILSAFILLIVQIAMAPHYAWRRLGFMLAVVAISVAILALSKRGHTRLAGFLLVSELWLIITVFSWTASGLGARAAWGYFIVVFIAGMLLGRWIGIAAAMLCSLSTLAVALFAPIRSNDPVRFWLVNSLYLLLVLLLQNMASRSIRESLARAQSELHERHLAESELRKSEERFRIMFESGPIGIVTVDSTFHFSMANRSFCAMVGYDEDELRGMRFQDITHPDHIAGDREALQGLLRGESPSYRTEKRYLKKSGGFIWGAITVSVIRDRDGRFVHFLAMIEDITARKMAERDREEIISLLKATLESTADGILVIDSSGKIANYNQRFPQMWRIPESVLTARDDNQALAFVMDQLTDPQGFMEKVQELYATPDLESFDLLEFKDGRFFERYSRPQRIDGNPVGRVWSFREITERKQAEKEISAWKQRFEHVAAASGQVVYDYHFRSGGIHWSGSIEKVLGYRLDEMEGGVEQWAELIAPGERAPVERLLSVSLRSGIPFQSEYGFKHKKGHYVRILDRGYVMTNPAGTPESMVGMMQDITERKQAELALQESEHRYRTLFEAASDAIFLMKGNLFFDCNSKTLEIYGCTREQILGVSPDIFSPPLQPDGRDSRSKAMEKIAAAYAGQPQNFEWVHIREDQTPFIAEVSLTRIELVAGVFLLAMVRDISERKRLEEQLRQAQKMEAIGILAGGVAHDFNNILSTIVGYGSLLQMKLKEESLLKGYVERILGASERAANLTSSLLAFSRKQEIELLPLDLNDVIYGFHKILARLIGEDIDFSLNLASRSLVVDADVRQIEQVLMNLANNSRDAMPRGGRLTISTSAVDMDPAPGDLPPGPYAAIAVADTGAGMEKEIQARIFEPFFTTKEVGKGTGLGLAIVYGIVKNHGGVVTVDSAPGRGTTFTILLPLKSQQKKKAERRKHDNIPAGSETILLIEDDPSVRQVTRSLLEEFGYVVLEAADGIAAQDIFRREQERIALVLCDLIMPKLNGRETLAAIQKMKKGIKAIFMSGYTADIIADKGIADAGMHLLLKPLNPGVLLKKVRSVLDKG
jgi:PAS domain S-box-containing protein